MNGIDASTWSAMGVTLSVVGLAVSVLLWRRRGAASGLRGVAWSLLPAAAGLTGTLRLLWDIGDSVVHWATRLVFSPVVWSGIVLAGVAVVLFGVSGVLRARGAGGPSPRSGGALPPSARPPPPRRAGRRPRRRRRRPPTRSSTTSRRSCASTASRDPPVRRNDLDAQVARHRLHARLNGAVDALGTTPSTPTYVVDLDAFDANAADLVRRAGGTPIRVATKSLRVPALITRALEHPGFSGVLAYSLREALWLCEQGISDDIVMGYPSVDEEALRRLTASPAALAAVTLMIDDVRHLDLVDAVRSPGSVVRVALDLDAGLHVGPRRIGPQRSPLLDAADAVELAREVVARDGFTLVGVMTYEGQVAGVPDEVPRHRIRSAVVRRVKSASVRQLARRRAEVASALHEVAGEAGLEFWNAGGSGSIETSAADPAVTEVTAGSGLLVSGLFDHYRSFDPLPAAYFGLRVVRRPSSTVATVAGGGLVASGPSGPDRAPVPWAPPGLHLTSLEGAGEVQTPLAGPGAAVLTVGQLVWFRHAKAGEVAEHVTEAHLLRGSEVVDVVPTYRGTGHAW